MVTERELLTAIAECEKEPTTNAKISQLADFYIVYDHLFGQPSGYSFKNNIEHTKIKTSGDTEFLKAVNGKDTDKVWQIVNEMAEAVKTLHPRMYDRVLEKLSDA